MRMRSLKEPIYLDYAAATPVDPAVLEAMEPYYQDAFYNPSASYEPARRVAKDVDAARSKIARWLGARGSEVVFTAGGTEANNLAIAGIMAQYPDGNLITSALEHPSVAVPARQYEARVAPVTVQGIIDVEQLEKLIDDRTVLISVMYANNEIGTIQPLRKIAAIVNKKRRERSSKHGRGSQPLGSKRNPGVSHKPYPLYFHTDAAQAAGYLDLHVSRLGVDLMTLNAGKIYGPKQAGALYVRGGMELRPLIRGGGQERGIRSGTENVAHIIGFAEALDLVQTARHEEAQRLQKLQEHFFDLIEQNLSGAVINGSRKNRLPNNIHITIHGSDNQRLIMELDARGILCAAGSACGAGSGTASPVLAAIGLDEQTARSSLRFTMGRGTTEAHVRRTVAALAELTASR
jgi:cysteine desulfurase